MKLLSITRRDEPFSLINFASFFGQDKKEIKQGLNILRTYFRDALVYKETQNDEMLINHDNSSFISTHWPRVYPARKFSKNSLVERAGETIEQNVNKSLTLETMAFKLKSY